MNFGRRNRIIAWLAKINEDLNGIEGIFVNNLIDKDEIGIERYDKIVNGLRDIQCEIDNALVEYEN